MYQMCVWSRSQTGGLSGETCSKPLLFKPLIPNAKSFPHSSAHSEHPTCRATCSSCHHSNCDRNATSSLSHPRQWWAPTTYLPSIRVRWENGGKAGDSQNTIPSAVQAFSASRIQHQKESEAGRPPFQSRCRSIHSFNKLSWNTYCVVSSAVCGV